MMRFLLSDAVKEFTINMKKWPQTEELQSIREQIVSSHNFRFPIVSLIVGDNNWDGCHYNHQLPCYKNEQKCEVSMTPLGRDAQ